LGEAETDGDGESDGPAAGLGDPEPEGVGRDTPSPQVTCSPVSGTTTPSRVTSPSLAWADPGSTAKRAAPELATVEPPAPTGRSTAGNALVAACVSPSPRPVASSASPVGWTGRPGLLTRAPSEASLPAHSKATPPPRNVRWAPARSGTETLSASRRYTSP